MKYVMIIPAKGHSSRLPGKNLRPFCGHPLVAWSIAQGVYATRVDEVWVSTDSDEIREVAESYGANVMMREYKDELETPGNVPVQEFVTRQIASGDLALDDRLITRLCTTPTLLPGDTDGCIEKLEWMWEHFDIHGITVAAELRTFHSCRKVVDGIGRAIIPDSHCENNYEIVMNLSALGVNEVRDMVDCSPKVTTPASVRGGEHPLACYYNVQSWQMQDVDTEDEFIFAEVVAEHFILKGRDMLEVYREN